MLQRRVTGRVLVLSCLTLCAASCGDKGPQGGPRVPTFPVRGQVVVDGQPAAHVAISLHSKSSDPETPLTSSAYTDAEGNFTIGTYEGADGAPAGDYRLTFTWREVNLMTGRFEGPDKLNDRYSDPGKSTFNFTVSATTEDAPENDWGAIELKTAN